MNHVGQVLNDYFNQTNPQWRRRCKIKISTNITKFFLQVLCELKIAQLKRANTLSMNPRVVGEGRVCKIAK